MRKRLDKIRFRGQRRDEFLDVADSPCNSDVESSEDLVLKPQILSREPDEAEGEQQAEIQVQNIYSLCSKGGLHADCTFSFSQASRGSSSASLQDDAKTDLNEIKGHLEIALLEKHFLREFKNSCLES